MNKSWQEGSLQADDFNNKGTLAFVFSRNESFRQWSKIDGLNHGAHVGRRKEFRAKQKGKNEQRYVAEASMCFTFFMILWMSEAYFKIKTHASMEMFKPWTQCISPFFFFIAYIFCGLTPPYNKNFSTKATKRIIH